MAKSKKPVKPVKKAAGKKGAPAEDRPKGVEMDFRIDDLTYAEETQPREGDGTSGHGIYADHVEDLRKAVRAKKPLPRARIWRVAGKGNFLTDGHHTTEARRLEGHKTVPAEVFDGEWWEAVADASGANRHEDAPLKQSHAEKRAAVKNLLKALKAAGKSWSNGRVAKWCDVSDDLVGKLIGQSPSLAPAGAVVGDDGKTYSKKKPLPKPEAKPSEGENRPDPTVTSKSGSTGPIAPGDSATHPPADPKAGFAANVPPQPRAEEARTFDYAAFESHVGALERDIDKLAEIFGVKNTPRTEHIRRDLREFKAAFRIWNQELGENARVKK